MLKDQILKIMQDKQEVRTLMEWAAYFKMETEEEIASLQQVLDELIKEFEVVISRKQKYILAKEKGIYKGEISLTRSGSAYLDFTDRDSIYIPRKDIKGAMDKDLVVVQEKAVSGDGKVIAILKRHTNTLVGDIMGKRRPSKFIPDNNEVRIPVRITNDKEFGWPHEMKVQLRITEYHEKYLLAEIERILGKRGQDKVEILAILVDEGVITEFPEEVINEAKSIPQAVDVADLQGRRDLREELIVTIDGADAKDLDDAISLKKHEDFYRLGVHIADVSTYVRENSSLDKEAYERGTSTYVVDRVVPMLPSELSNGICSLLPDVNRYTVSCVMDINDKGEIINYEIFPSLIRSHARMTYEAVNKILRGSKKEREEYADLLELFADMKALSEIIRRRRENKGALDFQQDEAKIIVDEKSRVKDIQLRKRDKAEMIIEDFMICANECVARHMRWLEYPFIYRVHEKPDADKIREFAVLSAILGYPIKGNPEDIHALTLQKLLRKAQNTDAYPLLSSRMLRSMQKARYAPDCLGHFGLALQEYCHFTSPIRRYPDLIVHRMLYKYVFSGEALVKEIHNDEAKMSDISKQSSVRERVSMEAERAVEDMLKAEYMQKHIGQKYDGIITTILSSGFFVQLSNTVEGFVALESMEDDYYSVGENMLSIVGRRKKQEYRLGEKIRIQVKNADRHSRRIDFTLLGKKNK